MEIIRILDQIEEDIKSAKKMPLTAKSLVEPEFILDKLDRIRAVLPEEVEAARLMILERDRIFEEARKEARYMLDDTKFQVSKLVSEDEITRHANLMAEELLSKTEDTAREIRKSADEYAENLLKYLKRLLEDSLSSVNQGISEISEQSIKAEKPQAKS